MFSYLTYPVKIGVWGWLTESSARCWATMWANDVISEIQIDIRTNGLPCFLHDMLFSTPTHPFWFITQPTDNLAGLKWLMRLRVLSQQNISFYLSFPWLHSIFSLFMALRILSRLVFLSLILSQISFSVVCIFFVFYLISRTPRE